MPAPQVVGRAGNTAPWITTYYVPPAGEGPNPFAAFWSGFNASRTPDAEMLFRLRLQGMNPAAKEAEMAKLLNLDAELAEKAAESQRYSQEFQSSWDKNQVEIYKADIGHDNARMDAASRVEAAKVGLDVANIQSGKINDKLREDLLAYNTALGEVRSQVARANGDPSAIAAAASALSVANETFNRSAQAHISNGGEAGTIAASQATALDGLMASLPQDTRAVLSSGVSTLPQIDIPTAPNRGVGARAVAPPDLRGTDGGFSVSAGRSGGAGVSGKVPSTGAGPGGSVAGSTTGSAGASMVSTPSSFMPSFNNTAQTAIQSARDRLAVQMDQIAADWGSNPYGNIGDPLITRAPRGPRMPGEERQVAQPTPAATLPPAPATEPTGPTSAVIPSLAAHFDRSEGGGGPAPSPAPGTAGVRRPSTPTQSAPSTTLADVGTSFFDALNGARQKRATLQSEQAQLDEAAREMNALPMTPSTPAGPPPDQGPPVPGKTKTVIDWNKPQPLVLPDEEIVGDAPPQARSTAPGIDDLPDRPRPDYIRPSDPYRPITSLRAPPQDQGPPVPPPPSPPSRFADVEQEVRDANAANDRAAERWRQVGSSVAGAASNAAAPYTDPAAAWDGWTGRYPPPGTSPANPVSPDMAARRRFTEMFQPTPRPADTGAPIVIDEANDNGLAWTRNEMWPAPRPGSDTTPFDPQQAVSAYEAAHVNDDESLADIYARRKRAEARAPQ